MEQGNMKITRRELLMTTAAVSVPLGAQPTGEIKAATDALDSLRIPAGTEPAFAFKA